MKARYAPQVFCPGCSAVMYYWHNPYPGPSTGMAIECQMKECQFNGWRYWVELPTIELTDPRKI